MPPQTDTPPTRRTLTLDVEKYQAMLDGSDMSADERKQVLEALWLLVVSFVDLGFEVKPAENACGQELEKEETAPEDRADMVELPPDLPDCFNEKTATQGTMAKGRSE